MGNFVDETGNRYGRLTVLERAPRPPFLSQGYVWWRCRCDCGKEHLAAGQALRAGYVRSCGCLRSDRCAKTAKDMTGQRFGRLVAVKKVPAPVGKENDTHKPAWWLCKCDCGRETIVRSGGLRRGATRSCGCLKREIIGRRNKCK